MGNLYVMLICTAAYILLLVPFFMVKSREKKILLAFYDEEALNIDKLSSYRRRIKRMEIPKWLLKCLLAIFIASSSGIVLLRVGAVPRLQRLLVTSAMTTLSHKYIAYIVAEPDKVVGIMDSNRVEEVLEVSNNWPVSAMHAECIRIKRDMYGRKVEQPLITVEEIKGKGYKGYMMVVSDPSRVSLVVSSSFGKQGQRITQMVEDNGALAGVNAGGFTDPEGRGNGGVPTGLIIKNGELLYCEKGTAKFNLIGFNRNNLLVLGRYSLEEIKQLNIRDGVAFRPFLILNGNPVKIYGDGGWGIGPRTVIGQREDGTVLFLVIDGRQPLHSLGATIKEVQSIMVRYGAVNAANLDGGSSTVMYYDGGIINKPCAKGGDRRLPSAFIIK